MFYIHIVNNSIQKNRLQLLATILIYHINYHIANEKASVVQSTEALLLAETVGFEPTCREIRQLDFESSSL